MFINPVFGTGQWIHDCWLMPASFEGFKNSISEPVCIMTDFKIAGAENNVAVTAFRLAAMEISRWRKG